MLLLAGINILPPYPYSYPYPYPLLLLLASSTLITLLLKSGGNTKLLPCELPQFPFELKLFELLLLLLLLLSLLWLIFYSYELEQPLFGPFTSGQFHVLNLLPLPKILVDKCPNSASTVFPLPLIVILTFPFLILIELPLPYIEISECT
jgi:hypothetical protein